MIATTAAARASKGDLRRTMRGMSAVLGTDMRYARGSATKGRNMTKGPRRRQDPDALTEEETAFLRSERTPATIRQYILRQHETVGVRTTAYRKVAAAANAERDALMAVATLTVVRAAAEGSVT